MNEVHKIEFMNNMLNSLGSDYVIRKKDIASLDEVTLESVAYVDSLSIIKIITLLEKELNYIFTPDKINFSDFYSLGSISILYDSISG